MPRLLTSVASLALALGLTLLSTPAYACDDCTTGVDGTAAEVGAVDNGNASQPHADQGSSTAPAYHGPYYQYRYVVSCMTNGPENAADAMCNAAVASCPDDEIRYRVYRKLLDGQGRPQGMWQYQGSECRGPDEPTGVVPPQVTTPMVLEQARREAPRPSAHVEPAGRSYVNVPNNFYADAEDAQHTVQVLGNTITISFQVSQIGWNFGDGETGSGKGVKDAAVGQVGAVEHAYARHGAYDVTASTSITVQFTLPDGGTVTVPDAIQQTSEPVPLRIGEIQTTVNDVG